MAKTKIPTPADIESKNPNEEKKDKVLELLAGELTKRKKGDKGDKPIFSDHVDPAVRELVIADLEEQGWSVTVKKIYGGKLHWYIQPA